MCLLEGIVSNRRTEKVIEKSVLTVPSKCCPKEPTSANTPALHGRTALEMRLKVRGYAKRIQLLFLANKPAGIPGAIKHSLCCCSDSMFIKQLFYPCAVSLCGGNMLTIWILCFPFSFDSDFSHKTSREVSREHSVHAKHPNTKCTGYIHTSFTWTINNGQCSLWQHMC